MVRGSAATNHPALWKPPHRQIPRRTCHSRPPGQAWGVIRRAWVLLSLTWDGAGTYRVPGVTDADITEWGMGRGWVLRSSGCDGRGYY